jgi:hypothetical protein
MVFLNVGNMDAPPQPEASSPELSASTDTALSASGHDAVPADKAFVFGSTIVSRPRAQIDVSVGFMILKNGEHWH